jgi:hypothetical protein
MQRSLNEEQFVLHIIRRYAMALPIAATPVLTGQDAKAFSATIEKDLKKPSRLVPTPKLEQARKLIKQHASKRKESPAGR